MHLTLPGLSKIFGAPKPKDPPAPPPLPDPEEARFKQAEKDAQRAALKRKGISGTKKTAGLGDTSEPTRRRATLLGEGVTI